MDGLEDARQALQFAKNAPTAEMRAAYAAQGILMLLISDVEQPIEPGEQWQPPENRRMGDSQQVLDLRRELQKVQAERDAAKEALGKEGLRMEGMQEHLQHALEKLETVRRVASR